MFKVKRDGTHRARLVALGYSQVPGIDFTEIFAPVVNDVTFRIALTRIMVENLWTLCLTEFQLKRDVCILNPSG